MIYETARDWREATHKRVLFYGMSGLGKTHLATLCATRATGFIIRSITASAPATWAS